MLCSVNSSPSEVLCKHKLRRLFMDIKSSQMALGGRHNVKFHNLINILLLSEKSRTTHCPLSMKYENDDSEI